MKKTILAVLALLSGAAQAAFVWIGGEITSSAWNNQFSWSITGNTSFGGNNGHWGSYGPGIPDSGKWDQITLNHASGSIDTLEGWSLKLKLISSNLTVAKIKKFQGGGQLDIDADSILTFNSYTTDGNDGGQVIINCEGVFNLAYTKNQGGDGFFCNLGKTGVMNLTSSTGDAYTVKIASLEARLETEAVSGSRRLLTLGTNMNFDSTETAITINAAEGWQKVNNQQEAQQAAEAGNDSYWVTKDGTGILLSWVKGKTQSVPEPTSATLSLLALTAFVRRRRRN